MIATSLFNGSAFSPEDITILTAAFEDTIRSLGLVDRSGPATEVVAKLILTLAQQGERDPIKLRDGALGRPPRSPLTARRVR
jgi:hypothetical protein